MLTELRLVIVLTAMLTLPGWAMLALSGTWRQWEGLQRWIVAVSLSIAFYPVLFYGLRLVIPFLTLGPYKIAAMLLASAGLIVWQMRRHWKDQFIFDQREWVAVGVFAMTLFTRFWVIRENAYPAWSDSLHHTLLTQLTAVQGGLPVDMEPYFPIPLSQYHLGLYSLTATVQWLAQVPAHTALLWTAQALNGLCALGVYLVLDRRVGRVGAIAGAVAVGLLSHQPAFYVNWGRFTQIASQSILLIAWLVTWEAMSQWQRPWRQYKVQTLWNTAFAAVLCGAVFFLHFRVAAFLLPLILMSAAIELWRAQKERKVHQALLGICTIGIASLIVVSAILWKALNVHLTSILHPPAASPEEINQTVTNYFVFSWGSVTSLSARGWLLAITGVCAVIGLVRRNQIVIVSLLWTLVLFLFGNGYAVGIPILGFTNMGAILIMFYLPIGLIIGAAVEELIRLAKPEWRLKVIRVLAALGLAMAFVASHTRVADLEPYRFFITPEDVQAMRWINQNTPYDAIFAVNTVFWLPKAPHGTDAGYWIPYFTGRQTTTGAMLLNLATEEYRSNIIEMSHAVEGLETDNAALERLQELGVQYVYIGQRGNFAGPGLNAAQLHCTGLAIQVYQDGGVSIFRIESP